MTLQNEKVTSNKGEALDQLPAGPGGQTSRIWPPDLKEITTTFIALVIVLVTTWMIYRAFTNAADATFDKDALTRSKDILAFALGLFGTVTGYYFGRVPAEKQADAARHSADIAKQGEAAAENRTKQVRQDVKSRIQGIISSSAPDPQAVLTGAGPAFQQSHASITGQLTSLLAEL